MVRLMNVRGALEAVADELGRRTSHSGCVNLETNIGAVRLEWDPGHFEVREPNGNAPTVRMPQWALAQLLYGYRHVSCLVADGVLEGPAESISSLARLFPVAPHYQYAVDHF
jgi:predicted acetyltransferase